MQLKAKPEAVTGLDTEAEKAQKRAALADWEASPEVMLKEHEFSRIVVAFEADIHAAYMEAKQQQVRVPPPRCDAAVFVSSFSIFLAAFVYILLRSCASLASLSGLSCLEGRRVLLCETRRRASLCTRRCRRGRSL